MPQRAPGFVAPPAAPPAAPSAVVAASSPQSPASLASSHGSLLSLSPDPLADLAGLDQDGLWGTAAVDPMETEFATFCAQALGMPLSPLSLGGSSPPATLGPFGGASPAASQGVGGPLMLLGASPRRPSPGPSPLGRRGSPTQPVSSVTEQVGDISLSEPAPDAAATEADALLQGLFAVTPASILGATPTRIASPSPPASATGAGRITSSRSSMRLVAHASSVPVAQRASLRLAKELQAVGKDELRADVAATALVDRFKEPLEDVDIDNLALLTRIDRDAIHRAADKASTSRAATTAH